jgi:PAS domain S-box-containing protein
MNHPETRRQGAETMNGKHPNPISLEDVLELYKRALDETGLLVITDSSGQITYANQAYCAISGYTLNELTGNTHQLVKSGKHPPGFYEALWNTILSGKIWKGTFINKKKNGDSFHIHTTIFPFPEAPEKPVQFMAVSKELTDNQVKESTGELSRQERPLLSGLGHELRTPLYNLAALSSLLLDTPLSPTQVQYIWKIKESTNFLTMIIDDLMINNVARTEKPEAESKPFSLSKLLGEFAIIFEGSLKIKGKELKVSEGPPQNDTFFGDAFRVKQILTILTTYLLSQKKVRQVHVTADSVKDEKGKTNLSFSLSGELVFTSGNGHRESSAQLFEDNAGDLARAETLIGQLQGEVRLKRATHNHFNFHFLLPYPVYEKDVPEQEPGLHPFSRHIKVLVAEDVDINQLVMQKHLENLKLNYEFAPNGISVLSKLREKNFDIILMDMQMPVMDGSQTIQKIRTHKNENIKNIPIIAITASITGNALKQCLEAGADDYLPKPFDVAELNSKIHKLVSEKNKKNPMENSHKGTSSQQQENLINLDYLEQLSDGDNEFVTNMIQYFIEHTPGVLESMKESCASKDWKTLRNVSHKFKPQLNFMGITSILEDVEQIEQDSNHERNLDALPPKIEKTEKVCLAAIAQLRQKLEGYSK